MRDHFGSFLGQENALDNPNDLMAYSYDASGIEGKARLVVFPKSEEHVRKILTYANRTNIPVIPRGLGCNTVGQVIPENSIVIDMAHFDRIHTLNLKEGWVLVDAGVVAQDLQRALAKHGYRLPVAPKSIDVSSLGAMLATNTLDRFSVKNGRMSDNVLSLEVIDGTGKHYPDAKKDFLGMEGTCAIILRAKIKVVPIVTTVTSDVKKFDTLTEVMTALDEVKEDLTVISIEYMNPRMSQLAGLEDSHHLMIQYESDKGEYVNYEQQENLWKKREDAWDFAAAAGYPYIEDCEAHGEQLYDVLTWCQDINLPVAAHIGLGIVHPFFDREDPTDFYDLIKAVGARGSGQFGYGLRKKDLVPKDVKDKLIILKDEYDYQDIVNRGKLHDYA